jgi:hypothetical protein
MQRRTVLRLGLAGGALLSLAGGGIALMHRPAWRAGKLLPAGREVMHAVARGVLDGSLPATASAQAAALQAHLARLDDAIAGMSPATQGEVADLLSILALPPGRRAVAGLAEGWPDADVAQVQAALRSMRASSLTLRRQAYHALRDLTHGAYYADASIWPLLRYPGPPALA